MTDADAVEEEEEDSAGLSAGDGVYIEFRDGSGDDSLRTTVARVEGDSIYLDADDDLHEELVIDAEYVPTLWGIIFDPQAQERVDARMGTVTHVEERE